MKIIIELEAIWIFLGCRFKTQIIDKVLYSEDYDNANLLQNENYYNDGDDIQELTKAGLDMELEENADLIGFHFVDQIIDASDIRISQPQSSWGVRYTIFYQKEYSTENHRLGPMTNFDSKMSIN